MSSSDIKHSLRKLDFPECAKEALTKIDQLLSSSRAPSNKQLDLIMDIISEFIFCEPDRRSSRRNQTGLNYIQELQLIDVICNCLSSNNNEITKNTIFLSLFGGTDNKKRIRTLCTLASMAMSALNKPMLLAVGTWLQQTGCSSILSHQLAESLIRDHFQLNVCSQTSLKSLAEVAPLFVANFMAVVTELYLQDGCERKQLPPRNLLEVITAWVYSNSKLCMSAQLNPPALPIGSIPMAAVTPISGLIRWCVLAPLYMDFDNDLQDQPAPVKKPKLESKKETQNIFERTVDLTSKCTELELYRKLHVGVLHSLCEGKRSHGPPTAVNAQQIAAIVPSVQSYIVRLHSHGIKLSEHKQLQECLDRIGQAIQVALANGCVYGNISNLLTTLNTLTDNRLLRIVVRTHQKSI